MFLVNKKGNCIKVSSIRCVEMIPNCNGIALYAKHSHVKFYYSSEEERADAMYQICEHMHSCNDQFSHIGHYVFVTDSIESIDFGHKICVINTDAGRFTHEWMSWENPEGVKRDVAKSLGHYIEV